MIKRGLLLFIFSVAMTISFTGCFSGDNTTTYNDFAIVVHDADSSLMMHTYNSFYALGPVFAPELHGRVKTGDCIMVTFTINYDKQPANSHYYTASGITYEPINKRFLKEAFNMQDSAYNDSIHSILGLSSNSYDETILIKAECLGLMKQTFTMDMTYNPGPHYTESEIPTVYLKSKKNNDTQGSESVYVSIIEAFDMGSIFKTYGKDTIVSQSVVNGDITYRYVTFNLKYQSGMQDSVPVYKQYGNEPLTIFAIKK